MKLLEMLVACLNWKRQKNTVECGSGLVDEDRAFLLTPSKPFDICDKVFV